MAANDLFTRAQLALRNGNDREEIWVAYKGVIYDVGSSKLWRDGKHYEHWAGQDLTDKLEGTSINCFASRFSAFFIDDKNL